MHSAWRQRPIYFGATPAGGKLKAAEEGGQAVTLAEQRAQSWKREHPILRGADFAKVYAAKALKLEPAWDWEVLLEGTGGPLAVASRDGDGRGGACVVVAFDLADSNWPLMSSFPVFLARSVQWLRGEGRAAGEENAGAKSFEYVRREPR